MATGPIRGSYASATEADTDTDSAQMSYAKFVAGSTTKGVYVTLGFRFP
jgi:hypothetical protein